MRTVAVFAVFFLFVFLCTAQSGACDAQLAQLANFSLPSANAMWLASAALPGSLGNLDDCSLVADTGFVVVDVAWSTRGQSVMGLCVPLVCAAHSEGAALQQYVRQTTRWNAATLGTINVTRVRVATPASVEVGTMGAVGWLVVAWLLLCATAAVSASLHLWWVRVRRVVANEPAEERLKLSYVARVSASDDEATEPLVKPKQQDVVQEAAVVEDAGMIIIYKSRWQEFTEWMHRTYSVQHTCEDLGRDEELSLPFVSGIRVFSMVLVILANSYDLMLGDAPVQNRKYLISRNCDWLNCFLVSSYRYRVDAFYFIAAFLMATSTIRKLELGTFSFLQLFLHRLFRIAPLFWTVLLFQTFVFQFIGSGAAWSFSIPTCESWYIEALFLSPLNFAWSSNQNMCLWNDWFINVDLQLYMISAAIALVIAKIPKLGWLLLGFTIVLACSYEMARPYFLPVGYYFVFDFLSISLPVYMTGVATAFLNNRIRQLRVGIYMRWILCVVSAVAVLAITLGSWLYLITKVPTTNGAYAFLLGTRHFWFALAFAIVFMLLKLGYGGWFRSMLCAAPFRPLAKLSFGAYLIHLPVLDYYRGIQQTALVYRTIVQWSWMCLAFVLSLMLSFLTYWSIERPLAIMQRHLMGKLFKNRKQ